MVGLGISVRVGSAIGFWGGPVLVSGSGFHLGLVLGSDSQSGSGLVFRSGSASLLASGLDLWSWSG